MSLCFTDFPSASKEAISAVSICVDWNSSLRNWIAGSASAGLMPVVLNCAPVAEFAITRRLVKREATGFSAESAAPTVPSNCSDPARPRNPAPVTSLDCAASDAPDTPANPNGVLAAILLALFLCAALALGLLPLRRSSGSTPPTLLSLMPRTSKNLDVPAVGS